MPPEAASTCFLDFPQFPYRRKIPHLEYIERVKAGRTVLTNVFILRNRKIDLRLGGQGKEL
jgi:hypothetical protein